MENHQKQKVQPEQSTSKISRTIAQTRSERRISNRRQSDHLDDTKDDMISIKNEAKVGSSPDEEDDNNEQEVSNYNHQCYICDKTFSANSNLNRHLRKIHKENVQSPYNNVKCTLCEALCPSSSMYIAHLRNDHHVNINIENLKFNDKQSFEDWKYGIENNTMSQFIKSRGEKRTKNVNKTYYSCNRSGYYVSKARTQKALKKQGSRKINGRCPASMNVTVNSDSSYDVRFVKTHVGHDFSLKHLDLSEKDRNLIIEKLDAGVTKREIIKQLRSTGDLQHSISDPVSSASSVTGVSASNLTPGANIIDPMTTVNSLSSLDSSASDQSAIDALKHESASAHGNQSTTSSSATSPMPCSNQINQLGTAATNPPIVPISRIHLATTKDIHNILNSKHLDSRKIRHNYELNQFEAWMNEMKERDEDTGVILYKNQGDKFAQYPKLKDEDFILITMKPKQAHALKEHGPRCVVLESTHNVHCEYLHVAYLAVVDHQQKGCPVAFMFSTRSDSDIMEVFFSLLKERVGLVSTRMLISDEQHEFYQAWWRVMSMPLHNLLSPWTVFDNWSKKFDLVSTREKLRKIKRQLRTLLNETEQDKFSRSLKQLSLDHRMDPDVSKFIEFFDENYGKNPEVWSGYLRKSYNVSNYQLWRLHEQFKVVYKNGKNSKNMLKFVDGLMNLFKDPII